MSFGFFDVFHNSASASCVARDQTGGDLERGNKTNIDRRRNTDVGDDLHDGLHFRIIFNRDGGPEMQKVADISVLFFSAGANFWTILGHFWANLGNFGNFLGYFG